MLVFGAILFIRLARAGVVGCMSCASHLLKTFTAFKRANFTAIYALPPSWAYHGPRDYCWRPDSEAFGSFNRDSKERLCVKKSSSSRPQKSVATLIGLG